MTIQIKVRNISVHKHLRFAAKTKQWYKVFILTPDSNSSSLSKSGSITIHLPRTFMATITPPENSPR
ncbi:hypothetical protein HanPSC8_Chr17g0797411 [Helianthus annuus]|nr:hypothetical protein HanPSC8_Chr17g0797411 [Helianthus annuus]